MSFDWKAYQEYFHLVRDADKILELLLCGDVFELEELQSDESDCEIDVIGLQPIRIGADIVKRGQEVEDNDEERDTDQPNTDGKIMGDKRNN